MLLFVPLDMTNCRLLVVQLGLREAFQTKKRGNLGLGPIRGGGSSKNQKNPKFQLGKAQNYQVSPLFSLESFPKPKLNNKKSTVGHVKGDKE